MKTLKKSLSHHNPFIRTRFISFIVVLSVVLLGYSVAARSAEEVVLEETTSEIAPVTEGDTGTTGDSEFVTEAQAIEAASNDVEAYEPDNSGVNERDRGGHTLTPPDQSNEAGDLEITQEIRKAVMADDTLSFTAKNVKIITIDGAVTLRGPVKNEDERNTIDRLVRQVGSVSFVENQIEVSADDQQF